MSTVAKHDHLILRTLAERPEWLPSKVLARLDGYPDPSSCWLWTGSRTGGGYGYIRLPVSVAPAGHACVSVHRSVFIAVRGPVPDGCVLDHDGPDGCSNRACGNPFHVQPVTKAHNSAVTGSSPSALNAAKTECVHGHPLTGDNLYSTPNGRYCRTCFAKNSARRNAVIKEARIALGMTYTEYKSAHGMSAKVAESLLAHTTGGQQ